MIYVYLTENPLYFVFTAIYIDNKQTYQYININNETLPFNSDSQFVFVLLELLTYRINNELTIIIAILSLIILWSVV